MSELHQKLGKALEAERRRRNLTLEEVAVELKISEAYLNGIEAGDETALPAPLYFELFAKGYAQLMSIDYEATVEAIQEEIGPEPLDLEDDQDRPQALSAEASEEGASATQSRDRLAIRKLIRLLAAIVVVFAAIIVILKFVFPEALSFGSGPEDGPGQSVGTDQQATAERAANNLDEFDWGQPPNAMPDSLRLTLQARGESWVAVVADGDTALYRTLQPGRVREVAAKYRLRVSVGVPPNIDILLNGQMVDLRNPNGRVFEVDINQANRSDIIAGVSPYLAPNSKITQAEDLVPRTRTGNRQGNRPTEQEPQSVPDGNDGSTE